MKKITLILLLIAAASFLFLVTGCSEEDSGMSIEDRIKAFVSDLNDSGDRNAVFKEHFHSDSYSYNLDESDLEAVFPNNLSETYVQTSITGSGSSRTVYIDSSDNSVDGNYTFSMEEDGEDDWYIYSIYDVGSSSYVFPGTAP